MLIASVLKEDPKTHRRLKRMLFNQTNKTGCNFCCCWWNLIFQSYTYNTKTTDSLIFCQLTCRSCALFLPQESNWQKISELFLFVLCVALKKRISSKMWILSCFVWLKIILFNLLCVLGFFFFFICMRFLHSGISSCCIVFRLSSQICPRYSLRN